MLKRQGVQPRDGYCPNRRSNRCPISECDSRCVHRHDRRDGRPRRRGDEALEHGSHDKLDFRANGACAGTWACQSEALARFDGVVLDALKDVQCGVAGYSGNIDRMHSLERPYALAADSASHANHLYSMGRATFLDDLDASRSLTDSGLDSIISRVGVSLSQSTRQMADDTTSLTNTTSRQRISKGKEWIR